MNALDNKARANNAQVAPTVTVENNVDEQILKAQLTLMAVPVALFLSVYWWAERTGGQMRFSFVCTLFAQLTFAHIWARSRFRTHLVNGALTSTLLYFPYLAIRPLQKDVTPS